jgi:hypothetical protein
MSFKNVSLRSSREGETPSDEGFDEGKEGLSDSREGASSPWDSLRPIEPKADEPKPPSRIGKFFRKALRWVTGLIVVFGLGVGTTWFVRVQPMNDQIDDLKDRLQAAEITMDELESQIADFSPLEGEKNDLEAELTKSQLHVDVLRVLVDVTSAQLALANDDVVTAKASLTGTDMRLTNLQERLQGEDQQTIEGMRTRLALVLDELEADAFAAMSDLDVLASNLLALERSLFGN